MITMLIATQSTLLCRKFTALSLWNWQDSKRSRLRFDNLMTDTWTHVKRCIIIIIKVKVAHTRLPSVWFRSWSRLFAVSLQVTWVINPVVGCQYFPPGPQLSSQPLRGLLPILVNRGTMGVNSLPKTVTRQRRGCDLNTGPTAPQSSTLTTRLPSHPKTATRQYKDYTRETACKYRRMTDHMTDNEKHFQLPCQNWRISQGHSQSRRVQEWMTASRKRHKIEILLQTINSKWYMAYRIAPFPVPKWQTLQYSFLPRDATLARVYAVVVCLSVHHKPVLYGNDLTNPAGFGTEASFHAVF